MKIYKYYDGKIHGLEVRETAKQYIADASGLPWSFRNRFKKTEPTTPLQAVQEKINSCLTIKGGWYDRIRKINSELDILRELEVEYKEK